jgi:quinol monooxygenase YgiN
VDRPATQANPRRCPPASSPGRYFTTNTVAPEAPAWAPFKSRAFRWQLAFEPEPNTGPFMVTVHFTVVPERQAAFLEAMDQLRRSRLRTGATRWELYRDGERPNEFIEMFRVSSWEERLRQHEGRLTATDQAIEEAALAFSDPPAYGDHLLPP